MTIIGDKDIFAVEYEVTDNPIPMAYNCIWIQNKFFGNPKDTGGTYQVAYGLTRLANLEGNFYDKAFLNKSPEEIFSIIIPSSRNPDWDFSALSPDEQDSMIEYDRYRISFGENYDLFKIVSYAIKDIYHFSWQLFTQNLHEDNRENFKNYDLGVQHATVSLTDLKSVVNNLPKAWMPRK